ncbi:MAG TPA: hypothetical protein DDZ91_10975, partial [Firmicutes bacterium]|nr:hypothetical protein [Bacillota bacterium]
MAKKEFVEFELGRFKDKDQIEYWIEVEFKEKLYSSPSYSFFVGCRDALSVVKTVEFHKNHVM